MNSFGIRNIMHGFHTRYIELLQRNDKKVKSAWTFRITPTNTELREVINASLNLIHLIYYQSIRVKHFGEKGYGLVARNQLSKHTSICTSMILPGKVRSTTFGIDENDVEYFGTSGTGLNILTPNYFVNSSCADDDYSCQNVTLEIDNVAARVLSRVGTGMSTTFQVLDMATPVIISHLITSKKISVQQEILWTYQWEKYSVSNKRLKT